jgi:hypothetical protein
MLQSLAMAGKFMNYFDESYYSEMYLAALQHIHKDPGWQVIIYNDAFISRNR